MTTGLPKFKVRALEKVRELLEEVFTFKDVCYLRELIPFEDGHYRAVFDPAFFVLAAGQVEPSKSQWNTLKKKLKRRDEKVFVFKEHGEIVEGDARLYYLDFGFFAE